MGKKNLIKNQHPLAAEYYRLYVRFSEQLHNNYIQFEIYPELLKLTQKKCEEKEYNDQIQIQCTSPVNPDRRAPSRLRGYNLPGFINRLHKKEVPETILINSVSLFEAFISDIAKVAYLDNPEKFLLPKKQNTQEQNIDKKENIKLLRIIIKSESKAEAIERYVEEKLRGLFYDNPIEILSKNRLRFGFNNKITDKCKNELKIFTEVVARRNIIIHNLGKVDQKYLREVKDSTFNYGESVGIDQNYLFEALKSMNTIAKVYVTEVAISTTGKGLSQVCM